MNETILNALIKNVETSGHALTNIRELLLQLVEVKPTEETSYFPVPLENLDNKYTHFCTQERAEQVRSKIQQLLLLEHYKEMYCPDYEPNWSRRGEEKYSISYDEDSKLWIVTVSYIQHNPLSVYFASKDIAQKVCDILNAMHQIGGY